MLNFDIYQNYALLETIWFLAGMHLQKHPVDCMHAWKRYDMQILHDRGIAMFRDHISSYLNIYKFQTDVFIISGYMNFEK